MKIDYSQLQTYANCPKLYYFKYIKKLKKRKPDEGIQSRSFGSEIHHALRVYFETKSIDKAIHYFATHYEALEIEQIRTVNNGVELLKQFVEWWAVNFKQAEILGCEVQDKFDIGELKYLVKIDMIIRLNSNIFVVDFKTTTSKTHYFFRQFSPNMQVSGYCSYVEMKYGQCSGFIPLAMQFGFRRRKYKGEPAGFWCKFDYDIANRNKEQLADFRKNVSDWFIKLNSDNKWCKNEGFCESFYGCSFREICLSLDDPTIIENLYEITDPYSYLKEDKIMTLEDLGKCKVLGTLGELG